MSGATERGTALGRTPSRRLTDCQMWGHKGEDNPKGADGGLCHDMIKYEGRRNMTSGVIKTTFMAAVLGLASIVSSPALAESDTVIGVCGVVANGDLAVIRFDTSDDARVSGELMLRETLCLDWIASLMDDGYAALDPPIFKSTHYHDGAGQGGGETSIGVTNQKIGGYTLVFILRCLILEQRCSRESD